MTHHSRLGAVVIETRNASSAVSAWAYMAPAAPPASGPRTGNLLATQPCTDTMAPRS